MLLVVHSAALRILRSKLDRPVYQTRAAFDEGAIEWCGLQPHSYAINRCRAQSSGALQPPGNSMEPAPAPAHRRTAEEAIAQANAKERIRNARGMRAMGIWMLLVGISLLTRRSTWRPYNQLLGVHIHGGPSFRLSLGAIVGMLAVVVSPILFVAGRLRLRRALGAAARDP
jgi:hypothetical protein